MMNNLEEMLKDFCLLLWCGYVTVMSIKGAFQAEDAYEVYVAFWVWMLMIAIPVGIRGK